MEPNTLTVVVGAIGTLLGTAITAGLAYKTTLFQGKQRGEDLLLDSLIKEKAEIQNQLNSLMQSQLQKVTDAPLNEQELRKLLHQSELRNMSIENDKVILNMELEQSREKEALWRRRCSILHRKKQLLEQELAAARGESSGSTRIFAPRPVQVSAGGRTEQSDLIVLAPDEMASSDLMDAEYDEMDSQAIEDDLDMADEASTVQPAAPVTFKKT